MVLYGGVDSIDVTLTTLLILQYYCSDGGRVIGGIVVVPSDKDIVLRVIRDYVQTIVVSSLVQTRQDNTIQYWPTLDVNFPW